MTSSCSSSRKKKQRHCSSSLVKPKRHRRRHLPTNSNHQYCRRDWSNMRADILEDVHKKLTLADTLISRSICSLWRSVSENHLLSSLNSSSPPSRPPILWREGGLWFLDVDAKAGVGNLYIPNHETKQLLVFQRGGFFCIGSSHRYLLFKNVKKKNQLYLLHPLLLSAFAVRFPPINSRGIVKALVLSDPIITDMTTSSCYGFAALDYDFRLMFARCGANSQFAELECQDHKRRTRFTDIICIKNCIYSIRGSVLRHHMEAWDCSNICGGSDDDDVPKKVMDFQPTFNGKDDTPPHRSTLHLVESQGELWLVAIRRPFFESPILHRLPVKPTCSVYWMDFKEKKWVRVDSLGDHVLIITKLQTMSLSAKEFPQYKRNSIYFEHYKIRGPRVRISWTPDPTPKSHLVVFNMEDGSLNELKTSVAGYSLKR